MHANNPFDSDESNSGVDHYDDEYPASIDDESYLSERDGYGDDNRDPSASTNNHTNKGMSMSSQQPVEASWQLLGDLPYRRVALYDEIQWGTKYAQDNENIRDSNNDNNNNGNNNNLSFDNTHQQQQQQNKLAGTGLAIIPHEIINNKKTSNLNRMEYEQFIRSTTNTIIASCPNGGPIATLTATLTTSMSRPSSRSSGSGHGDGNGNSSTPIRIMTNAGQILTTIEFPPQLDDTSTSSSSTRMKNWFRNNTNHRTYNASDILTMGFTGRCTLIIVLRDSICLTYNLSGKPILEPFYILNETSGGGSSSAGGSGKKKKATSLELMAASIYDGGVAVLSSNMTCALVELLDSNEEHDALYRSSCHVASRVVKSMDWNDINDHTVVTSSSSSSKPNSGVKDTVGTGMRAAAKTTLMDDHHASTTSMYALITPIGTSTHAMNHFINYTSIAVLPRIHTQSRHPEVFLGTSINSVIICDTSANGGLTDVGCQERISSPIVQMKFAPNGRFLACFTKSCIMTVISTNFETKVLDFDTSDGSSDLPHNMEWCGEDSVVLHWKHLGVLMVGPYGDWLRFPYSEVEHLHLSPEMDCCRVVTDTAVEILQRVPPATAAMLRIGSIEPAAMLLDASDAFENGSPSSDEAARAITKTGMLVEAISICTDAASKEFDIAMQKRLLKAASYGMHFDYKDGSGSAARGIMGGKFSKLFVDNDRTLPSSVAIQFVETAKKVRVLNALRDASVGVAITTAQYDSIEATGVIARLIAMKRPALATSLSTYLQLDQSVRAYARASRAAAFVTVDVGKTDAETAEAAIKILNSEVKSSLMNRGGYATVALAASRAGRPGIANLLLTLETSVGDKVPALTAIGAHSDAAAVAADAKNDDLIFHVLLEYEKYCIGHISDPAKAQSKYLSTIVKKFPPEAVNLLAEYFSSMNDVKHVMNLHIKAQNAIKAGSIIAKRAMKLPREHERLKMLQEASRIFGDGRDTAFQKTCTDEYLELLLEQERLRRGYGPDVTTKSSSVTETIYCVFCYAAVKIRESRKLLAEGEKLAKKFKVPEKRLWHTKIRAFSTTDQWSNLRALAESRTKPPIGFKYFALAVIKKEQSVVEILRYIEKVTDGEERYDLFCEAKLWKRAVDEAKKMEDIRRIMHVRTVCNVPEIQRLCEDYAAFYAK
mmetsp:Transcript_16407/g.19003  ORF Transcript_16407/g.19003 Transcript_16407/m.19003 type:complete len:1168 (-) Transcript_16407:25-3528(-)